MTPTRERRRPIVDPFDGMVFDEPCSHWRGLVTVYGEAHGQGSKRIGRAGGKNGKPILLDSSEKTRPWRQEVSQMMLADAPPSPLTDAVFVTLRVYIARPAAHYRANGDLKPDAPEFPPSGTDLDKVQRAIGDAGTGIWWRDDQQIARWDAERKYADGGPERVIVAAHALENLAERKAELAQARLEAQREREQAAEMARVEKERLAEEARQRAAQVDREIIRVLVSNGVGATIPGFAMETITSGWGVSKERVRKVWKAHREQATALSPARRRGKVASDGE